MYCWTGYIGAARGVVTAVVSQGSRISPAFSLSLLKASKGSLFSSEAFYNERLKAGETRLPCETTAVTAPRAAPIYIPDIHQKPHLV